MDVNEWMLTSNDCYNVVLIDVNGDTASFSRWDDICYSMVLKTEKVDDDTCYVYTDYKGA